MIVAPTWYQTLEPKMPTKATASDIVVETAEMVLAAVEAVYGASGRVRVCEALVDVARGKRAS